MDGRSEGLVMEVELFENEVARLSRDVRIKLKSGGE